MDDIDYSLLPEGLRAAAQRYVEHGIPPGGFLTACLSNDLKEAFGRADYGNRQRMFDIVRWIYNVCPSQAQGSPEKVGDWMARGGLGPAGPRACVAGQ